MTLHDIHKTLKSTLDITCQRFVNCNNVTSYRHSGEYIFLNAPENGVLKMSVYPSGVTSLAPELAISLGLKCVRSEASGLNTFELRSD